MKLILTIIYCAHYFLDPRFQEITGLSGTVFKEFKGHLFTSSTSIQDTFNLFKKNSSTFKDNNLSSAKQQNRNQVCLNAADSVFFI